MPESLANIKGSGLHSKNTGTHLDPEIALQFVEPNKN
jgi:hypothetical protein